MIPISGFPQSAYYAAPTTMGSDGQWSHGAAMAVKVRSEPAFQQTLSGEGTEGRYSGSVLLTPTAMVPGGLVWLPGRDQTKRDQALVVQSVQPATDINGIVDYYQVSL